MSDQRIAIGDKKTHETTKSFRERVCMIVQAIPQGTTMTYGQVAGLAGNPRAARAVGNILHRAWQTDHGETIPCHRVVLSDGQPGGYAGGAGRKRQLLQSEK